MAKVGRIRFRVGMVRLRVRISRSSLGLVELWLVWLGLEFRSSE